MVGAVALIAWVIGAMFATVALGAIIVGWRLSEGPVRVSFLTPYLQQSLPSLPEGWSISIGETFFAWDGGSGTVRIRTADVGFINSASQKVLSVPDAAFTIHGDALLAGKIEPKDLVTSGLRLVLTRSKDENWRLGVGLQDDEPEPEEMTTGRGVSELAADLFGSAGDSGPSGGVLGRISQFTLLGSTVNVVDQPNDRIYQIDARRLSLKSTAAGISVKADADISSRDLTVPVAASLIYRPDVQEVAGNVRFEDVAVQEAVRAFDGPASMSALAFPVSGTVGFRVSPNLGVGPLRLNLNVGEGTFDLPGIMQGPLPVRSLLVSGDFDPNDLKLTVERLDYDAGDFRASADGYFQMTERGPMVSLDITGEQVPLLRVPAYWPVNKGRAVREWLVRNVYGGVGGNVTARLNLTPEMWSLPAPPREAFDVNFEFEDGTVRLPEPFGEITEASGKLHVTGRELAIAVNSARLGVLKLADGVVTVGDFDARPAVLSASFVSTGTIAESVDAVLRGEIAAANKDMALLLGIGGQAAVRTRLSVPLSKSAKLTDAEFTANANLSGVVADGLFGDLRLRAETLELKLDSDAADLRGRAEIGGSVLDVHLVERRSSGAAFRREVAFDGTVNLDDLQVIGLDTSDVLSGAGRMTGLVRMGADDGIEGEADINLDGIGVQIEGIPWQKQPSSAGSVSGSFVRPADGPVRLKNLKAQAPGLVLQGDVALSPAGRLLDLRLERFDVAGSALSLVARQSTENARWQAQLTGLRLDLRPFRDLPGSDDLSGGPLDGATIDLVLEELVIDDDVTITRAKGELEMESPRPTGSITGLINGEADFNASASRDLAGWRFTLTSEEAGAVLSAVGLGSAIRKGRMNVHGVSTDDVTMSGLATIEDFTLTETPALARLISLASFTGIGEALSGRGLSFSRAEFPFSYANDRIDIPKGRMAGPSVGLTAEGFYSFGDDQLRFVGNLIPAYSISQVLGQIPLLGTILGGDQGLFGVTYVVEGPSSAPTVTVNPLSALAPGILRRMFLEPVEQQEIQLPSSDEVQNER